MSRAFVKEDDSLVEFQDRERARRERLELLKMFEKKREFLLKPDRELHIPEAKKKELLSKIETEITAIRAKIDEDGHNL